MRDSVVHMIDSGDRSNTCVVQALTTGCSAGRVRLSPRPASSSGVFVHHGEWQGRTQPAPPGFWEEVEHYGIGDYFFARPPAGQPSGSLDELPAQHTGAFAAV